MSPAVKKNGRLAADVLLGGSLGVAVAWTVETLAGVPVPGYVGAAFGSIFASLVNRFLPGERP